MNENDFSAKWVLATELRPLFPYWSAATFRAYVDRHKLPIPMTKFGGRWYCSREDVDKYIAENTL